MTDWNPITSAPIHPSRAYYEGLIRVDRGPRILAKGGTLSRVEIVRWSQKGLLAGVWITDGGLEVRPTHWLPLPK